MNAPPPSPEDCGSTRLRTSWTATAASAALPPARRISRPASVASGLAVATMWDFAVARSLSPHPVAASGAPRTSWAAAAIAPNAASARMANAEMMHAGVVGVGFTAMVGSQGLERPSSLALLFQFRRKSRGCPVGNGRRVRRSRGPLHHMWRKSHRARQTLKFAAGSQFLGLPLEPRTATLPPTSSQPPAVLKPRLAWGRLSAWQRVAVQSPSGRTGTARLRVDGRLWSKLVRR